MKKLLLSFFVASLAISGYATDYDTLYVKPGDSFLYELKLDKDKYPALENLKVTDVTWYVGDPYHRITEDDDVAVKLEDTDFKVVPGNNNTYNLSYTAKNDDEVTDAERLDYYIFYTFKVSGTRAGLGEDFFAEYTTDTVVFIHRYNVLEESQIKSITANRTTVREGENVTVTVNFDNGYSDLDAQTFKVVAVDAEGDLVEELASSNTPRITFKLDEDTDVKVIIENAVSEVMSDQMIRLTAVPQIETSSIEYWIVTNNNQTIGKELTDTTHADIGIDEGDRLTLTVNTNVADVEKTGDYTIDFSWNKEGSLLPDNAVADENKLTFASYDPAVNDGTYNCIISENDEQKMTVSFTVNSDWATSNKVIGADSGMKVVNGYLYLDQSAGQVKVYNINGSLVKTINGAAGSVIRLDLPKGVYIITNGIGIIKTVL